jgi:Electron transfer DM13
MSINMYVMKKVIIGLVIIVLLGIVWYSLSPLLNNKKIDDSLPTTSESKDTEVKAVVSEPVPVVDTAAHPASGQVRIVKSEDKTYIRYENYKTINGPDVQVWLAKDLKGKDYVNLGPLKGTEGNINYEVPEGIDVKDYRYALTWCEDFAVLFNSADLSEIAQ